MNILPKKSWHVANKKNIERVRRDEAEAERLAKIEQDRILQVQQEIRARELRQRAGIPEPDQYKHINLFEETPSNGTATNRDVREEKKYEEEKWQQKVGILRRLVKSEDVNKPWYCDNRRRSTELVDQSRNHSKVAAKRHSALMTSIYDPLTALKGAEQLMTTTRQPRRIEEASSRKLHSNYGISHSLELDLYLPSKASDRMLPIEPAVKSRSSSPEMVKYVRSDKKKTNAVDQKEKQPIDKREKRFQIEDRKKHKKRKSHKHKHHKGKKSSHSKHRRSKER